MFTWICPKCGAEVPPSETECPRCHQPDAAAPKAQKPAAAPSHPEAHHGMPGWLITVLVAFGLGLAALGGYYYSKSKEPPKTDTKAQPPVASGMARNAHPLAKSIEVAGVRVSEDAKKNVNVKLIVINHSMAEIPALELAVELHPATAKEEGKALSTFSAQVPSLAPQSTTEITATAKTSLRAYELPDWQFLKVVYDIVSPK